jgi:hypothetical protein
VTALLRRLLTGDSSIEAPGITKDSAFALPRV